METFMARPVLLEEHIHPAIRQVVENHHYEIIAEVKEAIAIHTVVVVGMTTNPMCKRARAALREAGIEHTYLEYGNYFNSWRKRNALKMWTGWPTFPMVFVKGILIGGASDLQVLIRNGDLKRILA